MANAAAAQPSPLEYQTQRAIILRAADQDVIRLLKQAQADIQRQLRELLGRPAGITKEIREAQLRAVGRNIEQELAKVWRSLGKITEARRAEAAARSMENTRDANAYRLLTGGLSDGAEIADAIYQADLDAMASGIDRMIARSSGASYVPLSERVYNSQVNIGSKVDRLVNSALARALSAAEFAKEVRSFINPLTPGGVSYAALRLARTEINNAAHAAAVESVREVPWVSWMRWRLSGSHGRPDICDQLARGGPNSDGRYPKGAVPSKPHPQCLCFVTPETEDDEAFLDNLVAGHYDRYLERYRGIQPGQVVRSPFGGGYPAPPAPKPKATETKPKPKPKGAKPPSQAAPPTAAEIRSVGRAAASAARVSPVPTSDAVEQALRAKVHLKPEHKARIEAELLRQAQIVPKAARSLKGVEYANTANDVRWGADSDNAAYYILKPGEEKIYLREHIFRPGYESVFRTDLEEGWFSHCPHGFGGDKATFAHEFGHHVANALRETGLEDEFWDAVGEAAGTGPLGFADYPDSWIIANRKRVEGLVSEYGATNAEEFLAEIWQEYSSMGKGARSFIHKVGEMMRRAVEEGAL